MFKLAVFNIQHLNSNWEDFFALNCRKDWSEFNALTSASPSLEIIVFQWSDMLYDYARIYVGHFSFKSVNIFFYNNKI